MILNIGLESIVSPMCFLCLDFWEKSLAVQKEWLENIVWSHIQTAIIMTYKNAVDPKNLTIRRGRENILDRLQSAVQNQLRNEAGNTTAHREKRSPVVFVFLPILRGRRTVNCYYVRSRDVFQISRFFKSIFEFWQISGRRNQRFANHVVVLNSGLGLFLF